MSAAQRREAAKVAYDAYLAACPGRQLLDRLSDKWVVLLMNALGEGPRRNAELGRKVAGISPKMLAQTLRNLEADGLLTRSVVATVPVSVTYELTELGVSLLEVVKPLKRWAEVHMPDVLQARASGDVA